MIEFLQAKKKWLTVVGALLLIAVVTLVVQAMTSEHKSMAAAPQETEVTFDFEKNKAYTAEDGIIVIPVSSPAGGLGGTRGDLVPPARFAVSDSEPVTSAEVTRTYYTLPEDTQMADGSIGFLSIPKIGLAVNIYETEDEMEAMTHGLAHFKTTSAWMGNIGICGHNVNFDLTDGYFKNIHKLKVGDILTYKTALGSRIYTVETVTEIAETDWSHLNRTEDNRITLVTCISGSPTKRLVVQALETS